MTVTRFGVAIFACVLSACSGGETPSLDNYLSLSEADQKRAMDADIPALNAWAAKSMSTKYFVAGFIGDPETDTIMSVATLREGLDAATLKQAQKSIRQREPAAACSDPAMVAFNAKGLNFQVKVQTFDGKLFWESDLCKSAPRTASGLRRTRSAI